jgi:hypothetical protein
MKMLHTITPLFFCENWYAQNLALWISNAKFHLIHSAVSNTKHEDGKTSSNTHSLYAFRKKTNKNSEILCIFLALRKEYQVKERDLR